MFGMYFQALSSPSHPGRIRRATPSSAPPGGSQLKQQEQKKKGKDQIRVYRAHPFNLVLEPGFSSSSESATATRYINEKAIPALEE